MKRKKKAMRADLAPAAGDPLSVAGRELRPAEEDLVALFSQPTPRERWRMHTTQAARLEREGDYVVAMRHWLTAAELAPQSVDHHWCGCRAQWCERQSGGSGEGVV